MLADAFLAPKYSLPEFERRWLVESPLGFDLKPLPYRWLEDQYITGTRLRLRKITNPDQTVVFKLCKKYGQVSDFAQAITNIYLSASEHGLFAQLPGDAVRKQRYALERGALDVYHQPHAGLMVFECEFDSFETARHYQPPDFVGAEITNEPGLSGAALAVNRSTPRP